MDNKRQKIKNIEKKLLRFYERKRNLHPHSSDRVKEKLQKQINRLEIKKKGLMLQLNSIFIVKEDDRRLPHVENNLNRNPHNFNEIIFELLKEYNVSIEGELKQYKIKLQKK